ncbi:MAG: hypothetical protein H8D56_15460 [Planctomycetes bacterium]|nr:hypothetical protein [Planctomycetota bacterium]MBL7144727.1 hypothetical protein [Phycisphaerae bacterium]
MRKITILILFWLIFISFGCTNQSALAPTQEPKSKLPAIVHIKTKNEVVTILCGQTGPLYNVTTKDGKILAQYLSEKQLQKNLPGIYRLLKTSYADNHPNNAFIWAGSISQH